eukprot:g62716.t1
MRLHQTNLFPPSKANIAFPKPRILTKPNPAIIPTFGVRSTSTGGEKYEKQLHSCLQASTSPDIRSAPSSPQPLTSLTRSLTVLLTRSLSQTVISQTARAQRPTATTPNSSSLFSHDQRIQPSSSGEVAEQLDRAVVH